MKLQEIKKSIHLCFSKYILSILLSILWINCSIVLSWTNVSLAILLSGIFIICHFTCPLHSFEDFSHWTAKISCMMIVLCYLICLNHGCLGDYFLCSKVFYWYFVNMKCTRNPCNETEILYLTRNMHYYFFSITMTMVVLMLLVRLPLVKTTSD